MHTRTHARTLSLSLTHTHTHTLRNTYLRMNEYLYMAHKKNFHTKPCMFTAHITNSYSEKRRKKEDTCHSCWQTNQLHLYTLLFSSTFVLVPSWKCAPLWQKPPEKYGLDTVKTNITQVFRCLRQFSQKGLFASVLAKFISQSSGNWCMLYPVSGKFPFKR